MLDISWKLHQYRRWMPSTADPAFGAAGCIVGGGRRVYKGVLGYAFDLLVEVSMVDRQRLIYSCISLEEEIRIILGDVWCWIWSIWHYHGIQVEDGFFFTVR